MKRTCQLLTACGVLASVATAQAASVSYDLNYGPLNVPSSDAAVGTLPKFDPALGTLQKVTLTLDANTSSGTIAWDNEAPVSTDLTLGIGAEVTVSALTALTAVAVPLQTDDGVGIDADNDGAADFLGTDAFSVVGGAGNDNDMDMSTLPATLALFTAGFVGEMFDVNLGSGVETFLSTTGGFGPIDPVPGITDGTVTVTYEYIPEPAAALLLAVGSVGLLRRRRS